MSTSLQFACTRLTLLALTPALELLPAMQPEYHPETINLASEIVETYLAQSIPTKDVSETQRFQYSKWCVD